MKLDGYREFTLLGTGPLGQIFTAIKTETGQQYRIKMVTIPDSLSPEDQSTLKDLFFKRCLALRKMNVSHSIDPINAGRTGNSFFIESMTIPYHPLVSLVSDRPRHLSNNIITIMRKIAAILHNYHQNDLTHGNLKISNIFLDDQLQPFLTDGVVSVIYEVLLSKGEGDLRDSRYLSIANLRGQEVEPGDDFFSLSVLFYRLLVGKYPFFEREKSASRTTRYHVPSTIREDLSKSVDLFFSSAFSQKADMKITDYESFIQHLDTLEERGIFRSEENDDTVVDRDDSSPEVSQIGDPDDDGMPVHRKRLPLIILAMVLLLIAGGTIGYLFVPSFRHLLMPPLQDEGAIPEPTAAASKVPDKSTRKTPPGPTPSPVPTLYQTITSTPEEIYLSDGQEVMGMTPYNLQLVGSAEVSLIFFHPGYLTQKKAITLSTGENETSHVKLISNPLPYPLAPGKAWRSFASDNRNTNCSRQKIRQSLTQLWSIMTEPGTASPVSDQGRLYLSMPGKHMQVIDLETGRILTTVKEDHGSICTPALTAEHIFVGSKDGRMRAYDVAKLKNKGEESVLSAIVAPPVVSGDRLYCATLFGTVTAFDVSPRAFNKVAMKKVWEIETGERISAALALDDDRLLLVSSGMTLNAFSAADGTIAWNFLPQDKPAEGIRLPDTISATMRLEDDDLAPAAPVVCGKTVVFATLSGWIYGLNVDNGREQWKQKMAQVVHATPVCDRGLVITAVRDGLIVALDAISGHNLYRIQTDSPITASPVIASDTLIIISETGIISLYEVVTGKLLRTLQIEGVYQQAPALAADTLVVLSREGRLTAFR